MAKGNVKKGFATYILILLLAIVATFLVLIVVAIFSPFKDILGFKYFSFKEKSYVYKVDGAAQYDFINFENLKKININCNYADVKIERSDSTDRQALYFENYSVGFARADQDVSFSYDVYYTAGGYEELNVVVHEPEGLFFLSKNISVCLYVPIRNENKEVYKTSFENTEINIINTSGDVIIGNNSKPDYTVDDAGLIINVDKLSIKKSSGKVLFRKYAGSNFNDVFIKIDKGHVEAMNNLNIKKLNIFASKAEFKLKKIVFSGETAILDLGDSKFYSEEFSGDINLSIQNGYFDLDVLSGTLISDNSENRMAKATIYIKDVKGSVSLPFAYKSRIDFDKIESGSQLQIRGTTGNISIDELYGSAWIETTKGNIDVHTYADDLSVRTTSGDINVIFDNTSIYDGIELTTISGEINLQLRSGIPFVLEVYDTKGNARNSENVNVAWLPKEFLLPYIFNHGTKVVKIISDDKIFISLMTK